MLALVGDPSADLSLLLDEAMSHLEGGLLL
jgi:hypothetical protein